MRKIWNDSLQELANATGGGLVSPSAPSWTDRVFKSAIRPLIQGADGRALVWSILGDQTEASISDQFKSRAGEYHTRYSASAHFEGLFRSAIAATEIVVEPNPTILDLGSGSGVNSVVPCLSIFPGARQVATDLSGELLEILAGFLVGTPAEDQVVCVVMDAMGDQVAKQQFDLVTGASILHHLVRPQRGIQAAGRALKPGGHAIFFEPFDGYGVMRLAFERILAEAALRREPLEPAVDLVLRGMVADITARTMPDVTRPGFEAMDDKWLFSRAIIEAYAKEAGFEQVQFVPHNDHSTLYRDVATIQLKLATGAETHSLPAWATAILDSFDAALPLPVKRLLMLEGTIVMTKAR